MLLPPYRAEANAERTAADPKGKAVSALIQRLLVARQTGHAPADLIDAVLEQLPRALPSADCRAARDRLLREAADLIPGTPWRRAETLAELIRRFGRPADDLRRLLWQAEHCAPLPRSVRQIHRILTDM